MMPVILIGAGGHAKVLIEALRLANIPIVGIVDAQPDLRGTSILGVPVVGGDDVIDRHSPEQVMLVNAIGSIRQPERRVSLFETYHRKGYRFQSVVHPSAVISLETLLGEGAQVMAGVIIQPGVRVCRNTIVNTRTSIDHDCIICDHAHLAPGVTLSGGVTVGRGSHIGAGATVIQGITIGSGSMVGAGAVVIRDVPDGATVMGVPAKTVGL